MSKFYIWDEEGYIRSLTGDKAQTMWAIFHYRQDETNTNIEDGDRPEMFISLQQALNALSNIKKRESLGIEPTDTIVIRCLEVVSQE